jgi:Na+/melibiose symporter-like transporter
MGGDRATVRTTTIPPRTGFCFNLKKNCQAIGRAIKMREIYCIVIFFIAKGVLNPSFEEFSYFFLLNVIGISKFMFALLVLIGQICHIIGALVYKSFFRSTDTRTMVLFAMISGVTSTFLNYCFAKRWNKEWGISDLFFLLFTDVVFSVVGTVLYTLPILALFAKITPPKVEGTIFAFLTGTMNLAGTVISPGMGSFINKQFIGCNKRDLSRYPDLILIQLVCSILTFTLLPLIPTKELIRE